MGPLEIYHVSIKSDFIRDLSFIIGGGIGRKRGGGVYEKFPISTYPPSENKRKVPKVSRTALAGDRTEVEHRKLEYICMGLH